LDRRGGGNRRFSDFIASLVFEFALNRANNHCRTRPADVQTAIMLFERAFPLERPKKAAKVPAMMTVHSLITRLDLTHHTPSALSVPASRASFSIESEYLLRNINIFRPLFLWVYDETGIEWTPAADDTIAPKGMHVQVVGKERGQSSTLCVAVNKHSRGRWARTLPYVLIHHNTAKPISKTREQHCPLFKQGLACDCTAANGEPGVDVKGLHTSTWVSIVKRYILLGQRAGDEGKNGLQPGDAWLGDLLAQHHDPEVMQLLSLARVWGLFFPPQTSIERSPLDNAGLSVLKGFVRTELQAVYRSNGVVVAADVERVVAQGMPLLLRSLGSMFRHCGITGTADAPLILPPPVQTTALPLVPLPPHVKPLSRGVGRRPKQPKAPTKRAARRGRARASQQRLQSQSGEWLWLSPVFAADVQRALLAAVVRACDSSLQNIKRKVRSGQPNSKRAGKREAAAVEALRARVSQEAKSLPDQLQSIADAAGRRLLLYAPVPDRAQLSKPR
jgi:hypothetical protein